MESVRQMLLHTQSYWYWLKMSPGGRLPGAMSTKGEGCTTRALHPPTAVHPPTAASGRQG